MPKLTRKILDEMILHEMHAMGLASSRPSKILLKEPKQEEEEPEYRYCDSLDSFPKAFDPKDRNVRCIIPESPDDWRPTEEERKTQALELAIATFNRFFRELDVDTRHRFLAQLRAKLIKHLTTDEINEIVSDAVSATKGFTSPVNKNRKPK